MPLRDYCRFVIALALGVCVLAPAPTHASPITLHVPSTVQVGDTFTVDVRTTNVFDGLDLFEEVLAFGFDIWISDPGALSFQGAAVAAPFDDDSPLFPSTDVAGSVFPGLPNDGTHTAILLATLSFQALTAGSVSLGIVSDLADLNEGLIYFLAGSRDITTSTDLIIEPSQNVPEPHLVTLLGAGLIGGLARRMRREVRSTR